MECTVASLPNVIDCVDVPQVHVHESIGGELHGLMFAGAPLVDGSIELIHVSIALQCR
jgi:hypothetical protein